MTLVEIKLERNVLACGRLQAARLGRQAYGRERSATRFRQMVRVRGCTYVLPAKFRSYTMGGAGPNSRYKTRPDLSPILQRYPYIECLDIPRPLASSISV